MLSWLVTSVRPFQRNSQFSKGEKYISAKNIALNLLTENSKLNEWLYIQETGTRSVKIYFITFLIANKTKKRPSMLLLLFFRADVQRDRTKERNHFKLIISIHQESKIQL